MACLCVMFSVFNLKNVFFFNVLQQTTSCTFILILYHTCLATELFHTSFSLSSLLVFLTVLTCLLQAALTGCIRKKDEGDPGGALQPGTSTKNTQMETLISNNRIRQGFCKIVLFSPVKNYSFPKITFPSK